MGAVDLVIQIEAPPSVAAGPAAGRPGRAPGRRGLPRRGLPQAPRRPALLRGGRRADARRPHRGDALPAQPARRAGPADRRDGGDGRVARRRPGRAGAPGRALRRAAHLGARGHPGHALRALPVDRLRRAAAPLVWDRAGDLLTARPGAQHLAVTSGGTIPDRGLFGVFLAGAEPGRRRVGELDEEMVYESRVGDVFLLGSTLLADRGDHPRPGAGLARARRRRPGCRSGRATSSGRPVELGRAIGGQAARGRQARAGARRRPTSPTRGLDAWAVDNLLSYVDEQREATRHLPDDRTVVVERFRDELGDWRLAVHCLLGAKVNGAWALAIGRRLTERYGVDAQVLPSDDGIVVRLPDVVDANGLDAPPGADLVAFDPDEIAAAGRGVDRHLGDVRRPVPRVRRPGPAAAPPRPAPAPAAVAAAPAGGPAARRGPRVRRLPDHPRGGPGVPAGRARRARPGRPDAGHRGPAGPAGRGRDAATVAVRPVAAVRIRRRVPLRRRRAAGRTPGGRAGAGLDPARRAAGPGGAARAARPGGGGRDRAPAAVARRQPDRCATPRTLVELLRVLGDLSTVRSASPAAPRPSGWPSWPGPQRGRRGPHRRRAALDRGRGRRPVPRRARAWRCRSASPAPTWSRWPTRSATWSPATPAPTPRSPRRPARPGSASACSWSSRPSSGSARPAG